MSKFTSIRKLFNAIHGDERGSVSLETILIIGAISLPILIFSLKFGWPKVRDFFNTGMNDLDNQSRRVTEGQ